MLSIISGLLRLGVEASHHLALHNTNRRCSLLAGLLTPSLNDSDPHRFHTVALLRNGLYRMRGSLSRRVLARRLGCALSDVDLVLIPVHTVLERAKCRPVVSDLQFERLAKRCEPKHGFASDSRSAQFLGRWPGQEHSSIKRTAADA